MIPQPPLPPLLKYLRLTLCGALHLLETDGDDIKLILSENGRKNLVASLETIETGVFWVSAQLGSMIAENSQKEED